MIIILANFKLVDPHSLLPHPLLYTQLCNNAWMTNEIHNVMSKLQQHHQQRQIQQLRDVSVRSRSPSPVSSPNGNVSTTSTGSSDSKTISTLNNNNNNSSANNHLLQFSASSRALLESSRKRGHHLIDELRRASQSPPDNVTLGVQHCLRTNDNSSIENNSSSNNGLASPTFSRRDSIPSITSPTLKKVKVISSTPKESKSGEVWRPY